VYFYSKTNQMLNISNLFYFGTTLYMFRTVFPSIIRSLRLYIQHQVHVVQVLWLLAWISWIQGLDAIKLSVHIVQESRTTIIHYLYGMMLYELYDIYLMLYVQTLTPDDGRKDRPKHVDCCSKIK